MSERRRAEEIFHELSELEGDERDARLNQLCGDDPELRSEVLSLLRHLDAVDEGFLGNQLQLATHRRLPETVGPYRIERLLGEGGMGSVYLAAQEGPLPRAVAVKVMVFGAHHSTFTQRFLSEQRTLAHLTHPNIAQVFDAGTTESGTPYFAMEHVDGPTLPAYCDEQRLNLNQRIRLFLSVCAGVQHAHQRGILHRDLKPSNLLVSTQEGQATPKIIDFGIAKNIDSEGEATPTLTMGPIGTPDYMSPEQMGGESLLDTRTDVYALGMILYQLLTGSLPHDPRTLRKMSLPQRLRHREQTNAPRPSQRLATLEDASSTAHARRTSPQALRRDLRNDLDWIVLHAIAHDPDQRYASAAELAEDLRSHLDSRPVIARPPDRVYLLRKAIRRNPLAWAIGTGAIVVLLSFLSVLVVQNRRISLEQARAVREATTAQRAVDFLVEMFKQADPRVGKVETAREILAIGRERVNQIEDAPEVRARLLLTMGVVHMEMGLFDDARTLLEESLALATDAGDDPAQRANAQDALATLLRQTGELERAEQLQRAALTARLERFGPRDIRTLSSRSNLGVILQTRGQLDDADRLFRETLASWPPDSSELQRAITVRHNIATIAMEKGEYARAESLLVEIAAERTRLLGPRHLETLAARGNLAFCNSETGRIEEAVALWEELLVIERQELGSSHPQSLRTATNLASAYSDLGAFDRAEPLLVEIVQSARASLGGTGEGTLAALNNLGTLRLRQGRWNEAIELFEEESVANRATFGEDSPQLLRAQANLAVAHRGAGNYDEAERLFRSVLEFRSEQLGPKHPDTLRTTSSLGIVHERQGRWADALFRHRAAYDGRRAALGAGHRSTLGSLRNLIRTLVQLDRGDEALELARQSKSEGLDIADLLNDPLLSPVTEREAWRELRD